MVCSDAFLLSLTTNLAMEVEHLTQVLPFTQILLQLWGLPLQFEHFRLLSYQCEELNLEVSL